jgi:hypothetical protein
VSCLGPALPVNGEITDARPGFIAIVAGVLRGSHGWLCHDQRVDVDAPAAEPVAAELEQQPELVGWFAEHHAVAAAVALRGRFAVAGLDVGSE